MHTINWENSSGSSSIDKIFNVAVHVFFSIFFAQFHENDDGDWMAAIEDDVQNIQKEKKKHYWVVILLMDNMCCVVCQIQSNSMKVGDFMLKQQFKHHFNSNGYNNDSNNSLNCMLQ